MTDNDLAGEIRQALEDTTPGPWGWVGNNTTLGNASGFTVYDVDHDHGCACRQLCEMTTTVADADRALIAAVPELLARAADRIAELEADLYEAKNMLADFVSDLEDGDRRHICYRCQLHVINASHHANDCPVRVAAEFIAKEGA